MGPSGRCVVATCDIPAGQVAVEVPDDAVLLAESSAAAAQLESAGLLKPADHASLEVQGLIFAVMVEKRLGNASKWAPYLEVLPADVGHMPFTWAPQEVDELRGTAGHDQLTGAFGTASDAPCQVELAWRQLGRPFLRDHPELGVPTGSSGYSLYCWATAVVASYSFVLGDERFVGMVPVWDLLNHESGRANVRLRHCAERGVLQMVTTRPVAAGEQLINSFGRLPSSVLLRSYGFVEASNPHDHLLVPLALAVAAAEEALVAAAAAAAAAEGAAATEVPATTRATRGAAGAATASSAALLGRATVGKAGTNDNEEKEEEAGGDGAVGPSTKRRRLASKYGVAIDAPPTECDADKACCASGTCSRAQRQRDNGGGGGGGGDDGEEAGGVCLADHLGLDVDGQPWSEHGTGSPIDQLVERLAFCAESGLIPAGDDDDDDDDDEEDDKEVGSGDKEGDLGGGGGGNRGDPPFFRVWYGQSPPAALSEVLRLLLLPLHAFRAAAAAVKAWRPPMAPPALTLFRQPATDLSAQVGGEGGVSTAEADDVATSATLVAAAYRNLARRMLSRFSCSLEDDVRLLQPAHSHLLRLLLRDGWAGGAAAGASEAPAAADAAASGDTVTAGQRKKKGSARPSGVDGSSAQLPPRLLAAVMARVGEKQVARWLLDWAEHPAVEVGCHFAQAWAHADSRRL